MTPAQVAHIMPPLPFAVFDEFGKSCEDRVADHYRAAGEAALRDAPQWPPCRGVPRAGCSYLAACDTVCNKCGQVHRFPFANPSAPTAVEPDDQRYQLLRRGQHWSVIDGVGDVLRGDDLDAAVDSILAARLTKDTP